MLIQRGQELCAAVAIGRAVVARSCVACPDTCRTGRYRFCANASYDACNWLVPADSSEDFCACCRHNRTIPNLALSNNLTRWRKFELAKHRLFYALIRLGLPLPSRAEDPEQGLVFDFLADTPDAAGHWVMTGHEDGLIAVNLAEADDAEREKLRWALGETYRTLLGHLRHESGHYFWDRLVCNAGRLETFREFLATNAGTTQKRSRCITRRAQRQTGNRITSAATQRHTLGKILLKHGRTIFTSSTRSKWRSRSVSAFGQGSRRSPVQVSLWTSIHIAR